MPQSVTTLQSGVHSQIERLANALEKLTLIVQEMIKIQTHTSKGLLALGEDNEALRNRVTELEEKCHAYSTRSGD